MTKRTDERLWRRVVGEITSGAKGGPAGKWSARKAQLAVHEYKKRGGVYVGKKNPSSDLAVWTKQDWGDVFPGRPGGRYLPRKVRDALSPSQKRRTDLRKRRGGARASYGDAVLDVFARLRKFPSE